MNQHPRPAPNPFEVGVSAKVQVDVEALNRGSRNIDVILLALSVAMYAGVATVVLVVCWPIGAPAPSEPSSMGAMAISFAAMVATFVHGLLVVGWLVGLTARRPSLSGLVGATLSGLWLCGVLWIFVADAT